MITTSVFANECVICPPIAPEFVCGVDDKGIVKIFGSECAMRFENCENKTSKLTIVSKYSRTLGKKNFFSEFQLAEKILCE